MRVIFGIIRALWTYGSFTYSHLFENVNVNIPESARTELSMTTDRTNFTYQFTYSSGPGRREVFECKYVDPAEALKRFRRILSLTNSPFAFKLVVRNEATKEESSYQVDDDVEKTLEKFRVFLETTTGISVSTGQKAESTESSIYEIQDLSSFEKMQLVIYASFKHGKFSSLDVVEIYEATFEEPLPKSTASTYLSRMWNNGKGHLERFGNRSRYTYRLKIELPEVQREVERAEAILSAAQVKI